MENNETNIFTLSNKNEENDVEKTEEDESYREEAEEEEIIKIEPLDHDKNNLVSKTQDTNKIRTNLEFLLSQNDILPLLKILGKDKHKSLESVAISKYMKNSKKSTESNSLNTKNARIQNKNLENEQNLCDSEEENDFVKIEKQPENLRNGQLKEYQMEALNWLMNLHYMGVNGILADEMGLGKTIQTISLLAYLNLQKASMKKEMVHIIIVPKVTIKNWQRELTKWLPELRVLFFYGDKDQRKILVDVDLKKKEYDLVLTTFECAMKEKTPLSKIKFEYLVIDEAHRIKNEKAKFSAVVRQFNAEHRLLLTGTPLQNNLHELWALLNFLMPNIFNDSEEFDKIFDLDSANEEGQQKIVKQIHQILRPFVLRRLKSEIEFKLPSKKEIYLYVGLSDLQKGMYKQILTKNIDVVNGVSKDKIQLLNILMQLKKVCNHPYLFPKIEKGPPFEEGEHLIYNCMKLKILDVLLKKIKNEGGKVLIFSQMTTLLNILDDYCRYRGFLYCRIDGSTSSDDRDTRIEDFQSPNSDKFIFLLSTRAGGLGINLHAANTVIIYDSDWNPQVDLQAIDRAHRIGQVRNVTVYRFVSEGTVEEKIIERAAKKLRIDHLIIQRGKPIQNKVTALEMTSIIQYGADKLFGGMNEETTEKDIEEILEYSISKTDKVNDHLKSIEEKLNINNLSLSNNSKNIYEYEGEDYKKKRQEDDTGGQLLINLSFAMGQRERKLINADLQDRSKNKEYKKPKELLGWRGKASGGYLHQFYDHESLDFYDAKETDWKEYLKSKEEGTFNIKEQDIPVEYTKIDEKKRTELMKQGFSKWTKKDFTKFLRACEIYGINDTESISKNMKSKTSHEVSEYIKVFQERIDDLPNGQRILAKINKYEVEKNKITEFQTILDELFNELSELHEDIFANLKIPHKSKNKTNNDRTDQELLDRSNYLLGCFKIERNKKKSKKTILIPMQTPGKNTKKLSKKKKKMKRRRRD